jgi:hypothetical protein
MTKKAAPARLLAVAELASSGAACDGLFDEDAGACWVGASGLDAGGGAEEEGSGWLVIGEDYITLPAL